MRYVRVTTTSSPSWVAWAEVEVYGAGGGSGAGEVNWLVSDHLGTPRMIADLSGSLAGIRRHDYLPFGEEVGVGIGGRTTGQGYSQSSGIRQGFTGYEKDGETGLNFAQRRYYSPTQGRFTSVDPENADAELESPRLCPKSRKRVDMLRKTSRRHPLYWGSLRLFGQSQSPQSWNGYAYARSNPQRYTDPTGEGVSICGSDGKCYEHKDKDFANLRKHCETTGDCQIKDDRRTGGRILQKDEHGNYQEIATFGNDFDGTRAGEFVTEMSRGETWNRATVGAIFNVTIGRVLSRLFGRKSSVAQSAIPSKATLSQSAGAMSGKPGYTAAGHSLTKHGAGKRPGNSLFPAPTGSPSAINQQAQGIVDDILNNPGTTFQNSSRARFGNTIEATAPDGRGIVFDANGKFLFFKE